MDSMFSHPAKTARFPFGTWNVWIIFIINAFLQKVSARLPMMQARNACTRGQAIKQSVNLAPGLNELKDWRAHEKSIFRLLVGEGGKFIPLGWMRTSRCGVFTNRIRIQKG